MSELLSLMLVILDLSTVAGSGCAKSWADAGVELPNTSRSRSSIRDASKKILGALGASWRQ
jgi:hypothetical protein